MAEALKITDPLLGTEVQGRYRIERLLGEGGMGNVYAAEHLLIGKPVAIKCLNAELSEDSSVVARFRREARAATAIGHEHIIDVTDMGDLPDGTPFMVMEFLRGRELADLLAEGPLPIGRAVHIFRQVCDALYAAHGKAIVHRDLKPENIFLIERKGDPDFVKVLDFGISKIQGLGIKDPSLTKTGIAIGTPHYMSPEQAQGLKSMDHRTDIYSIGVMLYRALAGVPPFDAETYPGLMVKVMTASAPPLPTVRSDIPKALDAVVAMALAKEPENRYPDAKALGDALRPFADLGDGPGEGSGSPVRPKSRRTQPAGSHLSDPVRMSSVQSPSIGAVRSATEPSRRDSDPRRWAALLMVGVGAVILLIGAVALAQVWGDRPGAEAEERAEEASDPTTPLVGAPPAEGVELPEVASIQPSLEPAVEVRVQISALPADARIFIDGVEFPNPMDAPRPRSLDPVTLRIERVGYQTIEERAVFDSSQRFRYRLERGRIRRSGVMTGVASMESPMTTPSPAPSESSTVYMGPTHMLRDSW
ncbi:MAG: protein kinase [Myxococcota bacterium]